jgi:hypothetical protein
VTSTDLLGHNNPGGDGLLSLCHWRLNLTITYPSARPGDDKFPPYGFGGEPTPAGFIAGLLGC